MEKVAESLCESQWAQIEPLVSQSLPSCVSQYIFFTPPCSAFHSLDAFLFTLLRITDCVKWCAYYGNIVSVHVRGAEAIGVRQVCESHQAREITTGYDIDAVIVCHRLLESFDAG